jgi:hypothetical protein
VWLGDLRPPTGHDDKSKKVGDEAREKEKTERIFGGSDIKYI